MTVSGFLSKTFDIFSDPANEEICSWGVTGETIHVKKIDEFSKTILPKYFKHSNFQSFVRQLNMYDFHKTVQDPGNGEFTHVNFRKNRPDLLSLIKRKAHNKHELRAKQQQQQQRLNSMAEEMSTGAFVPLEDGTPHPLASGSSSGATLPAHTGDDSIYMMAALEQEQQKQKRIREDFEWRLSQLEAQKARIYELEAQQGRLSGENYMLKHMLQDSREQQHQLQNKMEGVLKLMYHAFVNSGPGGKPAIGNGIPESRLTEFCSFLNVPSPSVLKLESGETLDSNGVLGSVSSGNGSGNNGVEISSLPESELITNADLEEYMNSGSSSEQFSSQGMPENNLKRKVQQVDSSGSAGAESVSSNGDALPDNYPKLEKVVSFDSLAGNIRPNTSKPPLSTSSNSKSNVGEYGINSPPQLPGAPTTTGGGMLSRQHSLELPPPGQSISGGYHYTPLSSAHFVKKQKTENAHDDVSGGRMEGQGLTRAPSLSRQDSEELGLPLGHMDSMDSTLASLFDISDHPDDQAID
mmetsp:Transcript_13488/g.22146  ORF Transcript_13488/g.22146 Transcript_13488/m.22146 type:complete len:523 (-) Transcript_13488:995-2563(-)